MIRAADLSTRVVLQRRSAGEDALGQPVTTWATHDTVWADVRHGTGMEAIKADARMSVVRASIRIRYRTDLTAGDRVLIGSTVYEITAVIPDLQRRVFTDLVCEVVA